MIIIENYKIHRLNFNTIMSGFNNSHWGSGFKSQQSNWRGNLTETSDEGWTSVSYTREKKSKDKQSNTKSVASSKSSSIEQKTTNSKSSKHYDVSAEIKRWARGKYSAFDMLNYRKIDDWTSSKSETYNRLTMIKELAKCLRHDVLQLLIDENPKFSANLPLKGFTPLQHVAFPSRNIGSKACFDELLTTAKVLIDDYGFRMFSSCEEDVHSSETVYGALLSRHNTLDEKVRTEFYTFLTEEAPIEWYLPNFRGNLNKLGIHNAQQFCNKMQFVLCRFPETIANIIFEQLMSGRAPCIELLKQVVIIFNTLLLELNDADKELNPYFLKTDILSKKQKFVDEFIEKGHYWVEKEASGLEFGSEKHIERIGLNTRIYYAALGCLYSLGFAKEIILDIMLQQITKSERPIWLVRAISMFLIHADIKFDTKEPNEQCLIVTFLNNCYKSAPVKDKMDIENALNVDYKQINTLLNPEEGSVATIHKTKEEEPDWEAIMASVDEDEIADFD